MKRRGDVDHRSTSGRGSHDRGRKQSRSKSPKEREARGGDGKTDSGPKKASRLRRHFSVSNLCTHVD